MRTFDEHAVPSIPDNAEKSLDAATARLARLICAHAPHDGIFSGRIPGLYFGRHSRIDTESEHTIFSPSIGIAAQGSKTVSVGQEVYRYVGSRIFVAPVAVPARMQTTLASSTEPFLGVRLDLNPQRISELVLKVYPKGLPAVRHWSAGYIINADLSIINAVTRLVECLSSSVDADLVAPLVVDEILIRLLCSPIGAHVAEMGTANSSVQRIAKAIAALRDNFSQQIKIADLADLVHMSVSSFHEHFKSVTSMSPLQYQKALRLHEARRLLLSGELDTATVYQLVGYVSHSQFSRDYKRFFGNPPSRDIARLRKQAYKLD
ncbi:AraC family transcriptional regulator [Brevibacillus brevis]|uniref:AraC family transcriptional regulator n=1 Tax=Brevibacillus brevis TaxID=1393 RepID=A0ABY9T6A4_BREBE|nr:AraC family transcriptional regulator [Brevibacillus brevis]WNC15624.1 AraC family transcriptional regulator [Brevibacillus brevis]